MAAVTHLSVFSREFKLADCEVLVSVRSHEPHADTTLDHAFVRHVQVHLVSRLGPVTCTLVLRNTHPQPVLTTVKVSISQAIIF